MRASVRTLLLAILIGSCVMSLHALETGSKSTRNEHKIGALIEVGELETAARWLQDLDAKNEIDPLLSTRLMGDLYFQLGQYGRAIEIYKSLFAEGGRSEHVDEQIALALVKLNDRSALSKHMASAAGRSMAPRRVRRLQGYDALKNSGSAQVIESLKSVARSGPQASEARLDLAWIFHEMGAFADVAKVLGDEARPTDLGAVDRMTWQFLLALSYQHTASIDLACDIYKEIAGLEAQDVTSHGLDRSMAWQKKLDCSPSQITRIPSPPPPASQLPQINSKQQAKYTSADSLLMNKKGTSTEDEKRVSYGPLATRAQIPGLSFPQGMGVSGASGILIGDGKFVLTNRHVVEMGKLYAVRNAMGRVSSASLVKVSDVDDLALLSVNEAFPAAQSIDVRQMAAARAGSQIFSMGYPLWFLLGSQTPSITSGLVSKISGLNDEPSMFQISAKVNKGNSGGPVFDRYGRLIGVTMGKLDTEYLRKTDGVNAEGVNFIIHTERILKFLGIDNRAVSTPGARDTLQPEMIYDKMLGAVVMVAVAIQ
jgi:serine protease Do